ncbi:MAG: hypothetical protein DRN20_03230 [Thermoplasmata archaeon]|nr:MAG: hypothetical protein DRN20_03230 [Thermoplasmata archaeon]
MKRRIHIRRYFSIVAVFIGVVAIIFASFLCRASAVGVQENAEESESISGNVVWENKTLTINNSIEMEQNSTMIIENSTVNFQGHKIIMGINTTLIVENSTVLNFTLCTQIPTLAPWAKAWLNHSSIIDGEYDVENNLIMFSYNCTFLDGHFNVKRSMMTFDQSSVINSTIVRFGNSSLIISNTKINNTYVYMDRTYSTHIQAVFEGIKEFVCTISTLNFYNCTTYNISLLYFKSSTVKMKNCTFDEFSGMLADYCKKIYMNNLTFRNMSGGVGVATCDYLLITNCTFLGGSSESFDAIAISSSKAIIHNNKFSKIPGTCIRVLDSNATIENNVIEMCGGCDLYIFGSNAIIANNTFDGVGRDLAEICRLTVVVSDPNGKLVSGAHITVTVENSIVMDGISNYGTAVFAVPVHLIENNSEIYYNLVVVNCTYKEYYGNYSFGLEDKITGKRDVLVVNIVLKQKNNKSTQRQPLYYWLALIAIVVSILLILFIYRRRRHTSHTA